MAVCKCVVFLVVLTFLWTSNSGDAEVCVLSKSCSLPCTFHSGDEVVIHWIQVAGNIPVHSYYHDQDQLARQNNRFSGRTSLSKQQISKGIASLQLSGVEIQDQGRYKCYTSTITGNKESFVELDVEAPVHTVEIEQEENRITCGSQGIYPEPKLTWSTSPPSNTGFQNTTTVQRTERQLYNVSGSVILPDNAADLNFSCTISSGRNKRTATLFKLTYINSSDTETTIPCASTNTPRTGLVWTFNHSQIILSWTGTDPTYTASQEWRQRVKAVSDSGSLTLREISSNQNGLYTCKFSSDEETHISSVFLRIEEKGPLHAAHIIAPVVVVCFLVLVTVGVVLLYRHFKLKKTCPGGKKTEENTELSQRLNGSSEPMKMQPNAEECDSTT